MSLPLHNINSLVLDIIHIPSCNSGFLSYGLMKKKIATNVSDLGCEGISVPVLVVLFWAHQG